MDRLDHRFDLVMGRTENDRRDLLNAAKLEKNQSITEHTLVLMNLIACVHHQASSLISGE